MISYTIQSLNGYSDKIGELVSMMEHTRSVTLHEIRELSQNQLDFTRGPMGNSVGALLKHIVSIEKIHQLISFECRDFNEEEYVKWGAALELGEKGHEIKEKPVSFYIKELEKVRKESLLLLQTKDDSWLFKENEWPNGIKYNNYYMWFHVMEDEINHRGQIRTLLREFSEMI